MKTLSGIAITIFLYSLNAAYAQNVPARTLNTLVTEGFEIKSILQGNRPMLFLQKGNVAFVCEVGSAFSTDRAMHGVTIGTNVCSQIRAKLATPRAEDIRLVIEVAASSMTYDRKIKARLYARYGIREFWVIDAKDRTTWVHSDPQGDGWGSIIEHRADAMLTSPMVPGFSIRLADI